MTKNKPMDIDETDIVNHVESKMPSQLKQEIGMLHAVKLFEDTIQVVLFNEGASELIIWMYKHSSEKWNRIVFK